MLLNIVTVNHSRKSAMFGLYRRPTFNDCICAFSRRLRIQFGPAWTRPHIRNTLIAFVIIANRGGGGDRIRIYCILAFKCGPTYGMSFTLPVIVIAPSSTCCLYEFLSIGCLYS